MKIAIAALALLVSAATTWADAQAGKWMSISVQRDRIIAGANFNISGTGRITGKALYYNGATTRVTGSVDEEGNFEIKETAPGFKSEFSGKANKQGNFFTTKVRNVTISGQFLSSSATYAGVYKATDSAGDLLPAAVQPNNRITLVIYNGSNYVFLSGRLKAGKNFSLSGSGILVEGAMRKGKIEGAYRLGGRIYGFSGARL